MLRLTVRLVWVLTLSMTLVGCSGEDPFALPTTPGTTPINETETFEGSVNRNGAFTHPFSTTTQGTVVARLVTLGPNPEQFMGMSLGTLNGGICSAVLSNDRSTQGTVITGGVSAFAQLCLRVYDVGTITAEEPFTYTITVEHP